jgi:hypothetical protein
MRFAIGLRGKGRVDVAAYGIADAEHLVEKEISRLCEGARVEIDQVARHGQTSRIAEEFTVGYRIAVTISVEAASADAARADALRQTRQRFTGTRYHRIEWEKITVEAAPT